MRSLVAAVAATACAACIAGARPDMVERVRNGELTEARVSWWGFDKADYTRFIAAALSSGAKKVVFDRVAGPWHTQPVRIAGFLLRGHAADDERRERA